MILDSPPVLRVADPLLLAPRSNVILVVARWAKTPGAHVAEVVRRLTATSRGPMATILTRVAQSSLDPEDSYGGYGDRSALSVWIDHEGERNPIKEAALTNEIASSPRSSQ